MTKDMTKEELQEYWRNMFIEKYEEAFGIRLELKKLEPKDDEDAVIVLNYYGIKSPWM